VTYVRMTRPLKPDEGGTNGRLTRIHSGELVQLAETCGEACGAAQTATHAAESGTWGSKRPLGYNPPADHSGTQSGKRSPVTAALINSALGPQRPGLVCTSAEECICCLI
jgi:hypothetical protein